MAMLGCNCMEDSMHVCRRLIVECKTISTIHTAVGVWLGTGILRYQVAAITTSLLPIT